MQNMLEDPKIYVLLNKTFRKVIMKIYAKKKNKNDALNNRVSFKKAMTSTKAETEINSVTGYQKIQLALWCYSAI